MVTPHFGFGIRHNNHISLDEKITVRSGNSTADVSLQPDPNQRHAINSHGVL
jgi:hypothetical protein